MNGPEILIPLSFFAATSFVIVKLLEHRQRMRMIDKGVTKVEFTDTRDRSLNSLKYGMVIIALGFAILIAQIMERFFRGLFDAEIALALVPIFIGIALIVFAMMERRAGSRGAHQSLEMKAGE